MFVFFTETYASESTRVRLETSIPGQFVSYDPSGDTIKLSSDNSDASYPHSTFKLSYVNESVVTLQLATSPNEYICHLPTQALIHWVSLCLAFALLLFAFTVGNKFGANRFLRFERRGDKLTNSGRSYSTLA